jgi:integrase
MASIRKRGDSWRVELYKNGVRESASFSTRAEAVKWALEREAELTGKRLPDHTLGAALERFAREVSPTHKGERWELVRCASLQRIPLARKRIAAILPADIAEWRDSRLKTVSASTVRREMTLVRSVFDIALREWGWIRSNPFAAVRKPPAPPARRRRITDAEVDRAVTALGYDCGPPENASQRVALAFLFALETAMRSGEIVGLTWDKVGAKSVVLPRTKNGDARAVPLSTRAREILSLLPRDGSSVFGLDDALRDALWRKARDRAKLENLHFHDSRAEAIWRLSKKLDVMQLARMIGHRDIRSLMLYYAESADELADALG